MQTVTTIGLDIAKSVFQVHGVDAGGNVVIRRQLKRRYVMTFFRKLSPCLVGIEACASSHHWSRELQAIGHCVRLMPPAYVKPYVKRHKNDATDAEAICEAVTRPNMRFVATKTPEQQSCLTRCSDQEGTSRPGSGLSPSRTRAEARTGSAVLANEAIAICAACSRPARSPSSAMPRSMAPSIGPGSLHYWRGDPPERSWPRVNATRNRPRWRLERDRAG